MQCLHGAGNMTKKGRYGKYGGQYVSETLMSALIELEQAYTTVDKDPQFAAELASLQAEYARPRDTAYLLCECLPGTWV